MSDKRTGKPDAKVKTPETVIAVLHNKNTSERRVVSRNSIIERLKSVLTNTLRGRVG